MHHRDGELSVKQDLSPITVKHYTVVPSMRGHPQMCPYIECVITSEGHLNIRQNVDQNLCETANLTSHRVSC